MDSGIDGECHGEAAEEGSHTPVEWPSVAGQSITSPGRDPRARWGQSAM